MINFQVRTDGGEIVARSSIGLDWSTTLQYINENKFPLLGSLLPYADTMFNVRQIERLRKEIANESVRLLLGQDAVEEIDRLCLQVKDGSHLYLWFVGD